MKALRLGFWRRTSVNRIKTSEGILTHPSKSLKQEKWIRFMFGFCIIINSSFYPAPTSSLWNLKERFHLVLNYYPSIRPIEWPFQSLSEDALMINSFSGWALWHWITGAWNFRLFQWTGNSSEKLIWMKSRVDIRCTKRHNDWKVLC